MDLETQNEMLKTASVLKQGAEGSFEKPFLPLEATQDTRACQV